MGYYIVTIHLCDGSTFETNMIAPNEDEAVEIAISRLHFQTGDRYDKTHVEIDVEVFE